MFSEVQDKDKELSIKEVMEKIDDLDFASYVKEVLSDAKETAFIIREIG